jgi:hypothetical protein
MSDRRVSTPRIVKPLDAVAARRASFSMNAVAEIVGPLSFGNRPPAVKFHETRFWGSLP